MNWSIWFGFQFSFTFTIQNLAQHEIPTWVVLLGFVEDKTDYLLGKVQCHGVYLLHKGLCEAELRPYFGSKAHGQGFLYSIQKVGA